MAIVVETLVARAAKADVDRFDQSVEASMMEMGGPPAGLMVHFTRPDGEGFRLCNVWRSESEMTRFYDEVILPRLSDAGLEAEESVISPVWVFARP